MKSAAERKADERRRRKEAGYVYVREWVHIDDKPTVIEYIRRVQKRRKKDEG